jgi:hypothetical protein
MWTDRPDQTESPYTVPPGWVQVESSLVSYSRSLSTAERAESFDWAASVVKFGLTQHMDLQMVLTPWIQSREAGQPSLAGFGDVQLRLKWNLVGNDEGTFAAAVMPYLHAPTASAGLGSTTWEGGLLVPMTWQISDKSYIATMAFAGINRSADQRHRLEPGASVAVGTALSERLGGYLEAWAQRSRSTASGTLLSVDGGLTFAVTDDIQLDAGVNWFLIGDRRIQPFLGLSFRF